MTITGIQVALGSIWVTITGIRVALGNSRAGLPAIRAALTAFVRCLSSRSPHPLPASWLRKLPRPPLGLLGESPNDTEAIKVLLHRRYATRITCFPLLERLTGGTLDSHKLLRALPVACDRKRPAILVVIRDLDALASDAAQLQVRRAYFARLNEQVGGQALYLLYIYEFEALIAADIQTFNALYKSVCKVPGDPTQLVDPKRVAIC